MVALLALLAGACAIAFPFAPVEQPLVRYHWPDPQAQSHAAAIPLMPYQPETLSASFSCRAVASLRASSPGPHVLLSTTPLHADSDAAQVPGLRVIETDGLIQVNSFGTQIAETQVPATGTCTWQVLSDPHRTELRRDATIVARTDADVRPVVTGVFTEARALDGLELNLVADTRFQTSPTPTKLALGLLCLACLGGMLLALGRFDRAFRREPIRLLPRDWWRPRAVDGAITVAATFWMVAGPVTVDDGYIAGIARSRGTNGFIGNVYRWLNAPEAPFSWFYELYYRWSEVSATPLWMRVPSTLLCLLSWWMLSRLLLPRLGRFARRATVPWLAAAAFMVWWMPFNLGLRPEPWVAAGALAVFCLVERSIATRTLRPLVVALGIAAATVAVTPGGILAFAPFVCAAVPLFRLVRARRDLRGLPLVVILLAAPASAVLLMFADQTFAAVLEAVRVRKLIGGDLPWYSEYERYMHLLDPAKFEGAIPRRTPLLLTVVAAALLGWTLSRRRVSGLAGGPTVRLVGTFVLALATMTLTPTKWTQHFGSMAGIGAAVLVVFCYAWSHAGSQPWHTGELLAGIAGVTVVGGLVLAGRNTWPYLSNDGLTWNTIAPQLGGVGLATLSLVAGGILVAIMAIVGAWRASGGRTALPQSWRRWLPAPSTLAILLVVATVALNVYSFGKAGIIRRNSYTLAGDSLGALSGTRCGLAEALEVEPDPRQGSLPLADNSGAPPTEQPTLDVNGAQLRGWLVGSGEFQTGWFRLSEAQQEGRLPVVLTTGGQPSGITAEFNDDQHTNPARIELGPPVSAGTGQTIDIRVVAPHGATLVRVIIAAASAPLTLSVPRSPELRPMTDLVPPGTSAILDWPIALFFPCLQPARLSLGAAEVPPWRLAPPRPDDAASITYSPVHGGPFVTARLAAQQQRVPVYLRGELTREPAQLYRWTPSAAPARADVSTRTVFGWQRDGRLTVPGLGQ